MTLNKNRMVREVGRRTRLPNREMQLMLKTLDRRMEREPGGWRAHRAGELPRAGNEDDRPRRERRHAQDGPGAPLRAAGGRACEQEAEGKVTDAVELH